MGIVVLYRHHKTKKGGKKTRGEKEILFERLGKMPNQVAKAKGRTHTQEHTETNKTTRWTLPAVEEGRGQASPQQPLP